MLDIKQDTKEFIRAKGKHWNAPTPADFCGVENTGRGDQEF